MSLTVTSPSAATYAVASQGAGTIAAYRSAWTGFIEWCGERGRPSLPTTDDALADYIAHRAENALTRRIDLDLEQPTKGVVHQSDPMVKIDHQHSFGHAG